MSGKKNLIMGLWSELPFDPLERFIGSLRQTAFDGDICVFVNGVSSETIRALLEQGIHVERTRRFPARQMNDQSSRYYNYLDFLARHGTTYANVMLSDLRHVVFQSDPFEQELPADIVFAHERRLLGESPVDSNWLAAAHGEAMAHNMRDCPVSCPDAVFGTVSGMLAYLAAMTHELSSLCGSDALRMQGLDQGIHNYIVRMRPLRNALLDLTDSIVATMEYVPDTSVEITERGVMIDDRRVPVLRQWGRNDITRDYVQAAPRFRLAPSTQPALHRPSRVGEPQAAPAEDGVVAFYHRQRDAQWLPLFLASLRNTGITGSVHCVGEFNAGELRLLSQYGCTVHPIAPTEDTLVENVAHFHLCQTLDRLAIDASAAPDQVLVLDSMRAVFPRDPFLGKTIGLSVFGEGATRLGESEYNVQRLAFFVSPDESRLQRPIVSSALLRGSLQIVRKFYHEVFAEFIGKVDLLNVQKVIQGTINKLCHDDELGFPIIVHPNAAEAYFDFWPSGLAIDTKHGVRIGGTVPAVVLGASLDTELMRALRIDLDLPAW